MINKESNSQNYNTSIKWNKYRYVWLVIVEYYFTLLGNLEKVEYYKYERDSMISRGTPPYVLEYIKSYLESGMSILDIGCGEGGFGENFTEYDIKYFGLEYNGNRVNYAKNLGRNVILGDMHDIQFNDNLFDIIIASEVLQQSLTPNELVEHWYSKLKINGYLFISLYNSNYWKVNRWSNKGRWWKNIFYKSQYVSNFNREQFYDLLRSKGINILKEINHPNDETQQFWIAICIKK